MYLSERLLECCHHSESGYLCERLMKRCSCCHLGELPDEHGGIAGWRQLKGEL